MSTTMVATEKIQGRTSLLLTEGLLRSQQWAAKTVDDARSGQHRLAWVWVVLIGILVLLAGAGFLYCRARGYKGFTGHLEAVKGPFGIKIGIKIGCY